MEQEALIRKLLALSEKHYQMAVEENWEQWERIMREKEKVWKRLEDLRSGRRAAHEENALQEIARWEGKTREELVQKYEETKKELVKIKRLKDAFKGYRLANPPQNPPRHFRVVC